MATVEPVPVPDREYIVAAFYSGPDGDTTGIPVRLLRIFAPTPFEALVQHVRQIRGCADWDAVRYLEYPSFPYEIMDLATGQTWTPRTLETPWSAYHTSEEHIRLLRGLQDQLPRLRMLAGVMLEPVLTEYATDEKILERIKLLAARSDVLYKAWQQRKMAPPESLRTRSVDLRTAAEKYVEDIPF